MSEFVRVGNHIAIAKGKPPAHMPYDGPGAMPYLSPDYLRGQGQSQLALPGPSAVLVSESDAVLLWDGSNAGEFFQGKAGIAASTMARLQAGPDFAPGYFIQVLKHAEPLLKSQTSGTGIPHVDREILESLMVFRPEMAAQRTIAVVLDTLDTTIRQTEAIIAKLKQIKQGLLHDLLTRGIDANGELRPPQSEAPHLYKASPMGWIPVEWDTATLGRLSTDSTIGPFGSDLVASDYRASGVPVVFVRDVKSDRFEWKSNVYVSTSKASALSAHEVRSGDVVATEMGLPPCVAAVYPESMPKGIITADIVRLRFDVSEVRPAWVSLSMNEHSVVKQVEQITAGVTRPKVTLRDVRNIEIRFPPGTEQDLILDRMASLENRLAAESAVLEKLHAQKTGLMDDLLTGRVRVTPLLAQATATQP